MTGKSTGRTARVEKEMRALLSLFMLNQMNSYFDCLVTIATIKVSKDLRQAKLYISILGEEEQKKEVLRIFAEFRKDMQDYLSKNMRMKYLPKLQFFVDDTYEENFRVMDKLKELGYENHPPSKEDSQDE